MPYDTAGNYANNLSYRTHIYYLEYSYGTDSSDKDPDAIDEEEYKTISSVTDIIKIRNPLADVTLVAQLSMDRLHMVEDLCR